jgi:uncharacterized protein YkwD
MPTRTSPVRARVAATLLAVVILATGVAGCMPAQERTFLSRTNDLRSSLGIASLQENDVLTRKAEDWAQHMAQTGQLEHSRLSDGLGSLSWSALGENVAMSSPTSNTLLSLFNMLASSSGHRANMVNSGFTHMGVGLARDSAGNLWVAEVFARL